MRLSAQFKPDPLSIPEAAARPHLPVYQDGEDIATYLTRFERVAELLQLDVGMYAVRLGCLQNCTSPSLLRLSVITKS